MIDNTAQQIQKENDILINRLRNEFGTDLTTQSIDNQEVTPLFNTIFTQNLHNLTDFQKKILQKTVKQKQREVRENERKTDAKYQMKIQVQKMCSNFSRCFVIEGGSKNENTAQSNREKYVAFFEQASQVLGKDYKLSFDKRCWNKGKILENGRIIKEIK